MKFISFFLLSLFMISQAFASEDVIADVYKLLNSDYINQADNRQITLKGLKSLPKLDSALRVSPTKDKIFLYYNREVVQKFPLPKDKNDTAQWVELSKNIIAEAIKVSDKVELLDFEIPDRFAGEVFKCLDGYSHYFGAFADNDEAKNPPIRRHFAARDVDGVLLIKVAQFQDKVSQEVTDALAKYPEAKGVILDLRGNHGGILNEALQIADMFLDEGIITYTAGKDGSSPQYYTSTAGDVTNNKPMVILVDGYTASAAEVLAAALSEQNRAILVGTKTYGKGTVQDVVRMDSDRAMALTVSYFYAPSGTEIDKKGLNPAICTGGVTTVAEFANGKCDKSDRFNEETDVLIAAKYIKNELDAKI